MTLTMTPHLHHSSQIIPAHPSRVDVARHAKEVAWPPQTADNGRSCGHGRGRGFVGKMQTLRQELN